MTAEREWWRGAVFYQIYPRSFKDSNGDGIGDLKGATDKLDYIARAGFDAIWLSPFYKSPMRDFGYDITDYCAVDPMFGTMDDFDAFLARAHELGLKVILDVVFNHTSSDHPWFIESRQNNHNPKADWYVWADPKPDGTPPNNWMSIFGGIAWTFDTKRGQYYFHNFIKEQPDLNFHHPDVQNAILDICRFWLDRGIDGFRLDVINFLFHDRQLRDNPPKDPFKDGFSHQYEKMEPYNMQWHIHDKSQPECIEFIRRLRQVTDEYPGTMTLGEIGDDHFLECASQYTKGHEHLNTAYNFALIFGKKASANHIRKTIGAFEAFPGHGWPSWTFCNHDNIRVVTRWGQQTGHERNPDFAKMLIALLTSLRGTIFMYQGEELGLTEADIPYEKIQDPWGKNTWPDWQGRDGCRTPIPWEHDRPHAGFSDTGGDTWLPVHGGHYALAVNQQEATADSVLNFTREFLGWRKTQEALIIGKIAFIDTNDDDLLAFTRTHEGMSMMCVFNLSGDEKDISALPASLVVKTNATGGKLPAFGFYFGTL